MREEREPAGSMLNVPSHAWTTKLVAIVATRTAVHALVDERDHLFVRRGRRRRGWGMRGGHGTQPQQSELGSNGVLQLLSILIIHHPHFRRYQLPLVGSDASLGFGEQGWGVVANLKFDGGGIWVALVGVV